LHLCIRKRDKTHQYPTERLRQYPREKRNQYPEEELRQYPREKRNQYPTEELRPYPKEVRHYSKTTEDYSQQNWNLKRKHDPNILSEKQMAHL